ncbi:hypothetical protein ACHHRT_04115 [Desulfurivibrio sp. D14AmB]|uniref:hypothetical protein n=1 Tax=Desulfurivibrio sp. D14AmB TaxID=3374370 RepID=UPI00376EB43B
MAGVKGRSGGPRPGSGRPRLNMGEATTGKVYETPEDFLLDVMNDPGTDARLRVDAAKALLARGKKAGQKEKAAKAATGRFAPSKQPTNIVDLHRR